MTDFRLAPSAHRFVAYHSGKNFAATWLRQIRKKMGLPPDENYTPWSSVVEEI